LERAWALGLIQTAAEEEAPEQPSVLNAVVLEEIAYGDATLALALAAPLGFVRALAGAAPAQRERHLAGFGDDAPRFAAIAHAGAVSARRDGQGWRLNGAKTLVPMAAHCAAFLVIAETGEGARAFVIPGETLGVSIAQPKGSLGLRALQMADVMFDNVFAPEESLLAGDIRRLLDASRVAQAAILSGLARAVYEYALPYTQQRVVHGEAIARKQAVAFKLADMHVGAQAMRWMALRAACDLDAGQSATRNASLARRYAAEHGLKIADEGLQIFGGHGFMRDLPLEMWCRNARSLSVLDGPAGV
jgi:alkylation response protein AidB-like acyl-CoA dehydrogenase